MMNINNSLYSLHQHQQQQQQQQQQHMEGGSVSAQQPNQSPSHSSNTHNHTHASHQPAACLLTLSSQSHTTIDRVGMKNACSLDLSVRVWM